MSVVIPFSQAIRERTSDIHKETESSAFIMELLTGKRTRDDYIALVAQQYFIYEALEQVADVMQNDPVAAGFITSKLTRLPAIEADLDFLIGADWRQQVRPLPATESYVQRIHEVNGWAGGFVAHHYTRYLGDLSGGYIIGRMLRKQFGFDTNGIGFYLFGEIAEPAQFKETYRRQLDTADWDEVERDRVVAETTRAFQHNAELFEDLAKTTAAA